MDTKTKILHWLTVILASIGGILAVADKVTALPLPPDLVQHWGEFVAAAVAVRPLVLVIGDLVDDGIVNGSFKLLGIFALIGALFGCATNTGNVSADTRGRVTNAVLADLFNTVVSAGIAYGSESLRGQNGQDAAQAAFVAAAQVNGVDAFSRIAKAYAGPDVEPIAFAATQALGQLNLSSPADRAAALNTVGAAIQQAANDVAK